jgi:alkylation response protein AidB-like acyl-CoA dehydrogenase
VLPAANRLDPVKGDMPRELIEKMGELGFFGILIPEELAAWGSARSNTAWSPRSWRAAG